MKCGNGQILGIPEDEYRYEFMVIIPRDDGNYDWHSNHDSVEAYEVAQRVGGIVAHDVRVAYKELKNKTIDK